MREFEADPDMLAVDVADGLDEDDGEPDELAVIEVLAVEDSLGLWLKLAV